MKLKLQSRLLLVMGGTALFVAVIVLFVALFYLNSTMRQVEKEGGSYTRRLLSEDERNSTATDAEFLGRMSTLKFSILDTYPPLTSENFAEEQKKLSNLFTGFHNSDMLLAGQYTLDENSRPVFNPLYSLSYSRKADGKTSAVPFPALDKEIKLIDFLSDRAADLKNVHTVIFRDKLWIIHVLQNPDQKEFTFYAFAVNNNYLNEDMVMKPNTFYAIVSENKLLLMSSSDPAQMPTFEEILATEEVKRFIPQIGKEVSVHFCEKKNSLGPYILSGTDLTLEYADTDTHLQLFKITLCNDMLRPFAGAIDEKIETLFSSILIVCVIGFLLLLIPLFIFAKKISEPISRAVAFANTIANGEYPPQAIYTGGIYEIAALMKSLNHMRDRLSNMFAKLKRSHSRELQARKDAENSNHVKSDFLNSISSDLHNPINSIIGFSTLLLRDIQREEINVHDLAAPLQTIKISGEKLQESIETILDLAKLDAADFKPNIVEFDVNTLTNGMVERFDTLIKDKSITIETHYNLNMPKSICTDRETLAHILSLIFDSLIRTSPHSGRIVIGCDADNKQISFWFKADHASKLAAELNHYIQSPKAKIFSSALANYILKLMIARNQTHLLGGEFDISASPLSDYNYKITFERLDIISGGTESSLIHMASNQGSKNKTTTKLNILDSIKKEPTLSFTNALILEESKTSASLLTLMLKDCSCVTETVTEAKDCLASLSTKKFNILIINVCIPNIDARPLIKKIRAKSQNKGLGIIALMCYQEDGAREEYLSLGVDICLMKPVNMDELLKAVRSLT